MRRLVVWAVLLWRKKALKIWNCIMFLWLASEITFLANRYGLCNLCYPVRFILYHEVFWCKFLLIIHEWNMTLVSQFLGCSEKANTAHCVVTSYGGYIRYQDWAIVLIEALHGNYFVYTCKYSRKKAVRNWIYMCWLSRQLVHNDGSNLQEHVWKQSLSMANLQNILKLWSNIAFSF